MTKIPPVKTEIHNGVSVPVNTAKTLEEIAGDGIYDSSTEEYRGPKLELRGKNNLQAAVATLVADAASGDPDARKELLDRVLGKSVQRQEIKSQNLTLVSFLDEIAVKEGREDGIRKRNEPESSGDTPAFEGFV